MDEAFRKDFEEFSGQVRSGIASGLYGFGMEFTSAQASRAFLDDRQVVMLTSNNYLGLADHPTVIEACTKALKQYGSGTCGARLHNGSTDIHRALERKLASWLGYDDAVMFSSGYLANLGTLSGLVDRETTVITDQLNHMSILDGCKLADGAVRIFGHNDMEKLEYALSRTTTKKKVVVVDGVYSMEGEIAPLPDIAKLAEVYGALLMVDEAHSIGFIGDGGRGACRHWGVRADILMGTFSKSWAGTGGFVATSLAAADYLRHKAHAYIFNASPSPAAVAGVAAAFDVMLAEPWRVEKLWKNTVHFRTALMKAGFDVRDSVTPIVPIFIGDGMTAMKMAADLLKQDVYIASAIFPAVPQGKSRFRATITAALETSDIDYAVDVLARTGRRYGIVG